MEQPTQAISLANKYGLSDKRALFVKALASGKSETESIRIAGFSESVHPSIILGDFRVAAALHAELARRLTTEAAPLAYKLLVSVVKDEKAPQKLRVECAKDLLNRAGFDAKRGSVGDSPAAPGKDLSAMTTDELKSIVGELENELSSRAKPVDAQETQGIAAQALDLLD